MTYSRAGEGLIIIDHTEVPAALRGRKVGERLVRQAVEDARRDGHRHHPALPLREGADRPPPGMAGRTQARLTLAATRFRSAFRHRVTWPGASAGRYPSVMRWTVPRIEARSVPYDG